MSRKGEFEYILDEMLGVEEPQSTPFIKAVGSFVLEELELSLIGVELGMDLELNQVHVDDDTTETGQRAITHALIAKSKLGPEAFRIVEREIAVDLMGGDQRLGAWTIFESLQKMAMSDTYRHSTLFKLVRLVSLFTMSGMDLSDVHVVTFTSTEDRLTWLMTTHTHEYQIRLNLKAMRAESSNECVSNYLPPPEGAEEVC